MTAKFLTPQQEREAFRQLALGLEKSWPAPTETTLIWQWRIARTLAICTGACAGDEPLRDALSELASRAPAECAPPLTLSRDLRSRLAPVLSLCGISSSGMPRPSALPPSNDAPAGRVMWALAARAAMSVLLNEPAAFTQPDDLQTEPTPAVLVAQRVRTIHGLWWLITATESVGIDGEHPDVGEWHGSFEDMCSIEEQVCGHAATLLSRDGMRSAMGFLRASPSTSEYSPTERRGLSIQSPGLSGWEAESILGICVADMRRTLLLDVESSRALLIARIDAFCLRARARLDDRAELQGLKLIAMVSGLGRAEPEDAMKVFADVARRLPNRLPSRIPELPSSVAPRQIEASAVVTKAKEPVS